MGLLLFFPLPPLRVSLVWFLLSQEGLRAAFLYPTGWPSKCRHLLANACGGGGVQNGMHVIVHVCTCAGCASERAEGRAGAGGVSAQPAQPLPHGPHLAPLVLGPQGDLTERPLEALAWTWPCNSLHIAGGRGVKHMVVM